MGALCAKLAPTRPSPLCLSSRKNLAALPSTLGCGQATESIAVNACPAATISPLAANVGFGGARTGGAVGICFGVAPAFAVGAVAGGNGSKLLAIATPSRSKLVDFIG